MYLIPVVAKYNFLYFVIYLLNYYYKGNYNFCDINSIGQSKFDYCTEWKLSACLNTSACVRLNAIMIDRYSSAEYFYRSPDLKALLSTLLDQN